MLNRTKWLPAFRKEPLAHLLFIAHSCGCEMPSFLPKEGWEALFKSIDTDREETEENEGKIVDENELRAMEEEADANREEIARCIRKTIMAPSYLSSKLLYASDEFISCMKDILARDEKGPQYQVKWPWKRNNVLDYWANLGYIRVMETPANEDPQCHRRINSILVTGDVLSLFEKTFTPELDVERRRGRLMEEISWLGYYYYRVAPLSVLFEIYQRAAKKDEVLSQEKMSKEEFYRAYVDEVQGELFSFQEEEEDIFQFMEADQDIIDKWQEEDEEGNVFTKDISIYNLHREDYEKHGYDFYVPDAEEIKEYIDNRYWPSRPPYQKLEKLLRKICEERFDQEYDRFKKQETGSLVLHTCGEYSQDDVEDDVSEGLNLASFHLMNLIDEDQVLEFIEEEVIHVPEEEKENLLKVLCECKKVTNTSEFRGYIPDEKIWEE